MRHLWAMFRWSLSLDAQLIFQVKEISVYEKLSFIFLKYQIFVKNKFFGWTNGTSYAVVFGERFYYNEAYGIASLQRVYCEHHHLRSLMPAGSIVVDVGANIGQFNFFSRHYLRARRVISIEPLAGCFAILTLNVAVPGDCYQLALSDCNGVRTMFVSSLSSSLSSYIPDSDAGVSTVNKVASRTLDDLVTGLGVRHVDLLKIDTEGSECDVIRGGTKTLAVSSLITIEMSVCRASSGNIFRIGSLIEDAGFRLMELSPYSGHNPTAVDGVFVKSE